MIQYVDNTDEKSQYVEEILRNLPEWFGIESSLMEYVQAVKAMQVWISFEDNKPVGCLALNPTSDATVDIHVMGVKKSHHGRGVGSKLFETAMQYAKGKYAFMQVKTVDEGHYPEYDQTIQFYKKCGFNKLEVFPTLWDEHNPCLILIQAI